MTTEYPIPDGFNYKNLTSVLELLFAWGLVERCPGVLPSYSFDRGSTRLFPSRLATLFMNNVNSLSEAMQEMQRDWGLPKRLLTQASTSLYQVLEQAHYETTHEWSVPLDGDLRQEPRQTTFVADSAVPAPYRTFASVKQALDAALDRDTRPTTLNMHQGKPMDYSNISQVVSYLVSNNVVSKDEDHEGTFYRWIDGEAADGGEGFTADELEEILHSCASWKEALGYLEEWGFGGEHFAYGGIIHKAWEAVHPELRSRQTGTSTRAAAAPWGLGHLPLRSETTSKPANEPTPRPETTSKPTNEPTPRPETTASKPANKPAPKRTKGKGKPMATHKTNKPVVADTEDLDDGDRDLKAKVLDKLDTSLATFKEEGADSLWRAGALEVLDAVKVPAKALIAAHVPSVAAAVLDTAYGEAALAYVFGVGLSASPYGDQPKVQRLAYELRVFGGAVVTRKIFQAVIGPIKDTLFEVLKRLPEVDKAA